MDNNTWQTIIQGVTLVVLLVGLVTLFFQKKQIHFSTVKKCIDDFRCIVRKQQKYSDHETNPDSIKELEILVRDHLGLVNEELFYMERKYLPDSIAKDWLMEMLEYIPVYVKDSSEVINKKNIWNSREVRQIINCNISNHETNYEKYIKMAKAFGKINKIFTVSEDDANDYKSEGNKVFLRKIIFKNIKKERNIIRKIFRSGNKTYKEQAKSS
jgi:hypothetical protein